jgi:plasmid maintenance system antidote protein VapI
MLTETLPPKTKTLYQTYDQTMRQNDTMGHIYEVRRANLKLLADQAHGPTNLAKQLGFNGPSYVSQMVNGNRRITEQSARRIESELGLETSWLDEERANLPMKPAYAPLNTALLQEALATAAAALEEAAVHVSVHKHAEFVAMLYEEALESGRIDERYIARAIKLMR